MTILGYTQPTKLSKRDQQLAAVLRIHHPIKGITPPIVAVEWYSQVRDLAHMFFPAHSDEWREFLTAAGFYEA